MSGSSDWMRMQRTAGTKSLLAGLGVNRVELVTVAAGTIDENSPWGNISPHLATFPGYAAQVIDPLGLIGPTFIDNHWTVQTDMLVWTRSAGAGPPETIGFVVWVIQDGGGGNHVAYLWSLADQPDFVSPDDSFAVVLRIALEACAEEPPPDSGDEPIITADTANTVDIQVDDTFLLSSSSI